MVGLKPATRTKRPSRRDSDSTPRALPAFRPPQLATLRKEAPSGDGWAFEMKYDGYRCEVAISGTQVRLFTRNGHDWSRQFGYVGPAFAKLTRGSALIDGELCALDANGRSNFTLLKNGLDGKTPLVFFAFDLLELDGQDLTPLPMLERKARLEALLSPLPPGSAIRYSSHVVGHGKEVLAAMRAGGFEGVVAKRVDSRYAPGERLPTWSKVKVLQRQEFVVIGWRPPDHGRDNVRGLFLGTYEGGKLIYRGGVGTGFTDQMRFDVVEVLKIIQTEQRPPVVGMPRPEMRAARWVQPRLLAEVEFTEITPDGLIRHPSFKGLREDKDANDVHLEVAEA